MNCPKCNNLVQPNARFCGICGQILESGPAPGQGAGGVPPGSVPASAPPPGSFPPRAAAGGASAAWAAASSAMPGLLERIKNIVLTPKTEWPVIAAEPTTIGPLFMGYVMPLAAFAALMGFLRTSVIGVSLPFGGAFRIPIVSGLIYALVSFGFGLLFVFLISYLINALAPTFSGTRDLRQATKVAAYAFTPAWICTVLGLSPVLPTLLQFLAACYGIYVLYLGLPILMRSPQEKAFGYTASVVVCTILLGILLGVLSAVFGHFGRPQGMFGANLGDPAAQSREQGADAVASMIGGALGTDDKGKAGLAAALSNLAKAGEESERRSAEASANAAASPTVAPAVGSATAGDSAQNPMAAVAGLATAFGGALGGNHRVAVVDFKTLTAMLPSSLPGMKRTDARGESQGAVGVKTSSATGDYQSENGSSIHVQILDLSGVSGLMDMAGAIVQNTESESDSGYERNKVIGGRPVHEKYDARAKHAELSVMLAKRYQVDVTGDGTDMSALEQSLGQIDLARLESMKDQGSLPQ